MTHRYMHATFAALLLASLPAFTANQVANRVDGPWVLYKGTTRVATAPTSDACVQLAVPLNPPRKTWSCKQTVSFETVLIPIPPTPIDAVCIDNGWQDAGPPTMCMNSQQSQLQTRTWTTVRGPINGGKACPIPEVRTITKQCTGPMPPMTGGPYIDPAKIPAPAVGYSTVRIQTTTSVPYNPDGTGAFRIPCTRSHFLADDPIVYPGQKGASHMHMFYGNTNLTYATTPANIDTGNSTCPGGTAVHSAAWIPAIVDTVTHAPVEPRTFVLYYKSGYSAAKPADIKALPKNLRMIAGALPTNAAHTPDWQYNKLWRFWCDTTPRVDSEIIPPCPAGHDLNAMILFPTCWDGVNLDSANHRSHMAYPEAGRCPTTHPVPVTEVTFTFAWTITAGMDTTKWRLASDMYDEAIPAGYSFHGDYWAAWQDDVQAAWMKGCVNAGLDCNAYLINADANGDGTRDEVY